MLVYPIRSSITIDWVSVLEEESVENWRRVEVYLPLSPKDPHGLSPLMIACKFGRMDLVQYLVQNDANLDQKSDEEGTCLHFAIAHGNCLIVELLLQFGCSVLEMDHFGRTALLTAAMHGRQEIISVLLAHGSRLADRDEQGFTCLLYAVERGDIMLVEFLLSIGSLLTEKDKHGVTSLLVAVKNGHLDLVTFLLSQGCSIEEMDNNGRNSLHYASMNGDSELVKFLVAKGCPADKEDIFGETGFLYSIENGDLEIVRLLITYQSNIDIKADSKGFIEIALKQGHLSLIEYLVISVGFSIKESKEGTIILDAIKNNHLEMAYFLYAQGFSLGVGSYEHLVAYLYRVRPIKAEENLEYLVNKGIMEMEALKRVFPTEGRLKSFLTGMKQKKCFKRAQP